MSKSSQKKGAQGAGREPGRGCAWDLQILKTFQGESAGLRPCAPRQGVCLEFKAFQKQCAHRVQAVDSPYMYSTPSGA